MRYLFLSLAILMMTTACSKAMHDFADGAKRILPPLGGTPAPQNPKGVGLLEGTKFSGGHVTSTGTAMGMTVTISPTQTALKNSAGGMRVGISRGPTSR